jgi:hypothetical protein
VLKNIPPVLSKVEYGVYFENTTGLNALYAFVFIVLEREKLG